MTQFINKSAVVAEIERLSEEKGVFYASDVLYELEEFIDTFEVKEVDLDNELEKYKNSANIKYEEDINMFDFAKHFFELGLKAQKGE